jgi:hypothetical protein
MVNFFKCTILIVNYCFFIGGTLGLFTGMSILSMIEIVFWAIKLGVKMFSSKK